MVHTCDLELSFNESVIKVGNKIDREMKTLHDDISVSKRGAIEGGKESNPDRMEDNLREIQERIRLQNNIIMYDIAESESEDLKQRKKQDIVMLDKVLIEEMNTKAMLLDPVRLGQKRGAQEKPRPLQLIVPLREDMLPIFSMVKNLALSSEENRRQMSVRRDMTLRKRHSMSL